MKRTDLLRRQYRRLDAGFIREQAFKDAVISMGLLLVAVGFASGVYHAIRHGSLALAIACGAVAILLAWICLQVAMDAVATYQIADEEESYARSNPKIGNF